jgi:hypothetical protein
MVPGQMQLTRMPFGPASRAKVLVSMATAGVGAAAGVREDAANRADVDDAAAALAHVRQGGLTAEHNAVHVDAERLSPASEIVPFNHLERVDGGVVAQKVDAVEGGDGAIHAVANAMAGCPLVEFRAAMADVRARRTRSNASCCCRRPERATLRRDQLLFTPT